MKIEIWSDFVCPFCYMGKRHLEIARAELPSPDGIEVVYRSFELDPDAPRHKEGNVHENLAAKYGMSVEEAQSMNQQMGERAAAVGLTYRFDTMIPTNTFDAHQLEHFAEAHGKMYDIAERLFKAYFTDGLDIGDRGTLAGLAAEVGLSREAALRALEDGQYAQAVRDDEREAAQLGIEGVPFFVIDRKYAVSGAQPVELFRTALKRAQATDPES